MGRIHRPTFAGPKDVTGNSYGLIFCSYDYARASMNTKYFLIRFEFVLLTMIAKKGGNSDGAAFRVRLRNLGFSPSHYHQNLSTNKVKNPRGKKRR